MKTANDGARTTRKQIVAKLRRVKGEVKRGRDPLQALDALIEWVLEMDTRANRKVGGLGRK